MTVAAIKTQLILLTELGLNPSHHGTLSLHQKEEHIHTAANSGPQLHVQPVPFF